MNFPNIEQIAICLEQDEQGKPAYFAHVFLDDNRIIVLDPCRTLEDAEEEGRKYAEMIAGIKAKLENET